MKDSNIIFKIPELEQIFNNIFDRYLEDKRKKSKDKRKKSRNDCSKNEQIGQKLNN